MMKIKYFGGVIAIALATASPVFAESKADELGLGNHEPDPEKTGKIDNDLFIRARLIREKSGDFAVGVKKGEIVRVQVDYLSRDGAKDRPVSLVCSVEFIDTKAEKSDSSISGKPCKEGRLLDYSGRYSQLDMNLRFRAETKDPAGTYGVIVRVEDSYSGKHVVLVPTYGWLDGKK